MQTTTTTTTKTHAELRAEYRMCLDMAMRFPITPRNLMPHRYWTNRAAQASAQLQARREA